MPLVDEFEKTGNWLFRWRSFIPLLFLGLFLIGLRDFHYPYNSHKLDQIWEIICLLIAFCGLFVRAFTIGITPKGTSGRNTKSQVAESLNTTGMYSIVRHPLYLGNFFIFLGVSLFPRIWWLTLLCVLLFFFYYERIIIAEEFFLKEKFGQQYLDWATKTPAFFFKIRNWKPAPLGFSFKNIIKREYHGFFGIIAAFTVLEIVGDIYLSDKLELDNMWILIFLVGLVAYSIIRFISKKTRLLDVEGR